MKRLLIIEDDEAIGRLEKEYLQVAGFDVHLVTEGIEGRRLALSEAFDLILVDVMLPGIDGFKLCESIRSVKDIPLMIVSARDSEIDKLKGLGLGIDDYITKPFSPHELVARVRAHLARYALLKGDSEKDRSKKIVIGDLTIDPESRRVFTGGDEVNLTVKEYDLLSLLASTPDKVFTKDEIFLRVWGYDADQDPATLAVHIRKLREKIEYNPSEPRYIKTVWGVGYKVTKETLSD